LANVPDWRGVRMDWHSGGVWTKQLDKLFGGNWEDPSWLGGLPYLGGGAVITNAGSKTVVFGPTTYLAYSNPPLAFGRITVSAPSGSTNRLVFQAAQAPTTLQLYGGLQIGANGIVDNHGAQLLTYPFAGNTVYAGGLFVQSGGNFDSASNSILVYGTAALSGGMAEVGSLRISNGYWGQSGGSATAQVISCSLGGTYSLSDGDLSVVTIQLGNDAPVGLFMQSGGSLTVSNIFIPGAKRYFNGGGGTYQISGGAAQAGEFFCEHTAGYSQTGGLLTLTNRFLAGGGYEGGPGVPPGLAYGTLTGGILSTPAESLIFAHFTQTGGTNKVWDSLRLGGATYFWDEISKQYIVYGSTFSLSGGKLIASNIVVEAGTTLECSASGTPGRIQNDGTFWLGGALSALDDAEQFGPLVLCDGGNFGSATVLLGSSGIVKFADSSTHVWPSGFRLVVPEWSGFLTGGGPSQLIFGTNTAGLTQQQLSSIVFTNPRGLAPATYKARILQSGEVVPDGRVLFTSVGASGLLLTWSGPYVLESSTDAQGPFVVVREATSPYTFPQPPGLLEPKRLFRLGY
jgi:hypothetical protein